MWRVETIVLDAWCSRNARVISGALNRVSRGRMVVWGRGGRRIGEATAGRNMEGAVRYVGPPGRKRREVPTRRRRARAACRLYRTPSLKKMNFTKNYGWDRGAAPIYRRQQGL